MGDDRALDDMLDRIEKKLYKYGAPKPREMLPPPRNGECSTIRELPSTRKGKYSWRRSQRKSMPNTSGVESR